MNWLNEVLHNDPNPLETQEWLESIKAVIDVVSRRDPTLGHRETSVAEAINWTREHRR